MRTGKTILRRALLTTALASGMLLTTTYACDECNSLYRPGIYTGTVQRIGDGVAYSWVRLNEKGKPAAVGITLTETALNRLPEKPQGDMSDMEFVLDLPKQAEKTALNHIALNWNPNGHEPNGIYSVPHFDFHFYLLSKKDRGQITAKGADIARCAKTVPAAFTPTGYVYAKGTEIPMMGGHWIDPKSPEFNGKPFTHTFIYGSYDGKMAFIEPMIAKSFLEARADVTQEVSVPARVLKSGYYPTRYAIRYDAERHEYTISLDDMVWREAGAKDAAAPAVASK